MAPGSLTKGGSFPKKGVENAEASDLDDAVFADRFVRQPGVTRGKIDDWNSLAVNLGKNGFPMAERLPIALSTTYKHLNPSGITSVFQAIERDEHRV